MGGWVPIVYWKRGDCVFFVVKCLKMYGGVDYLIPEFCSVVILSVPCLCLGVLFSLCVPGLCVGGGRLFFMGNIDEGVF